MRTFTNINARGKDAFQEIDRGADVPALFGNRNTLPRLTSRGSGEAVVEGQDGNARRGEVLFVLRQHHVAGGAEAVHPDDGGVWPGTRRQREPRGATVIPAGEVQLLDRDC